MQRQNLGVPPGPAPLLWADANDPASVSQSAGNVTLWKDKSGNGNNLTPRGGNITLAPAFGRLWMSGFAANSAYFLAGSSVTLTKAAGFHIFGVAIPQAASGNGIGALYGGGDMSPYLLCANNTLASGNDLFYCNGAQLNSASAPSTNVIDVVSGGIDTGGLTMRQQSSGQAAQSASYSGGGTSAAAQPQVGGVSTVDKFHGLIAEFILYGAGLTTLQLSAIHQWLGWKYGVTP